MNIIPLTRETVLATKHLSTIIHSMSPTSQEHDITKPNNGDPIQDTESGPQDNIITKYSTFTPWQKRSVVLFASLIAFLSPLSAQIYLPALPSLSKSLHVSSTKINLTITTYMIFQGLVPMVIGSLADTSGRRPAYFVCFVVYIAANIGLALAPSYAAVLALRCLQSTGSAPTVALCSAVVADVATSAERGNYIGITAVPSVLAPALGPVIGGLLSQALGWRAIFWFLTILAVVTFLFLVLFFPETCRPIVGDGSIPPPPLHRTVWQAIKRRRADKKFGHHHSSPEVKFKFKAPNVLGSLVMLFQKETGLLLATASITFAGFYAIATAMPSQFTDRYGLTEIQVGLTYLPLAGGSIIAACIAAPMMTWNYRRHCAKLCLPYDRTRQMDLSDFPIEKVRLEVGIPLVGIGALSLIAWGWAMQAHTPLAVPLLFSMFLGVGMVGFNNTTNVLLVDIHPGKPGTAIAANNFTRCLLGAATSAAIVPMIDGITIGWSFTLLGALYALCMPVLWWIMIKGINWRTELKKKRVRKMAKVVDSTEYTNGER